jgi:hypothetical protein
VNITTGDMAKLAIKAIAIPFIPAIKESSKQSGKNSKKNVFRK